MGWGRGGRVGVGWGMNVGVGVEGNLEVMGERGRRCRGSEGMDSDRCRAQQ